ncbi:LysR family transcriptional regulator [Hwanghaeella sp. LZ110]|uniref:LysR family transcriptional regulator n=1 Tax=Hwanghaeella sp. LZ110 TaxID=3402810 RepID=UPI003B67C026
MTDQTEKIPNIHLDLLTLSVFLAVADTGSIRAASERLHLSPSAVSRRLAELEMHFNQIFFLRHSRGVELTEGGQIMMAKAREVFGSIETARTEIKRLQSGEAGSVLLSANGSAFVNGLAEDLSQFHTIYPLIGIELFELFSPDVVDTVAEGRADLGLIAHTFRLPSSVETTPYCMDTLVLAVPKGHILDGSSGVTMTDLSRHDLIGVSEGSSMTRLMRRVAVTGNSKFEFRHMATTNEVARTLVSHGLGVAIMPHRFVMPYLPILPITIVPIREAWATREISIVRRRGEALTKTAELFFKFLIAQAKARDASS